MKNLTAIIFILLGFLSFSQEADYLKVPQLQTKATYTTEVQPDKITLSIILSENNLKGKTSVEEMEKRMEIVLNENNIDIKKQLTLKDLSSNFQGYFLKKTEVQKTKNYYLEVYDAITAGKILKGLEKQEISNVKLVKTEYSKIEELKIELKGKAVSKAKNQAEEMVKMLNQKLGQAIFISDLEVNYLTGQVSGLNILGLNSFKHKIEESEFDEHEFDINFDSIRVDATIIVYFKLE